MPDAITLDSLWNDTPAGERVFDGDGFPEAVRRYLTHAIAPGARLANAVRLRMRGEIRLGKWRPFEAEEVIVGGRGMIWSAHTQVSGLPVTGSDRYLDGQGEMHWKALGAVPFLDESGPDISRSAAGRVASESVWLPSSLCGGPVRWDSPDEAHVVAHIPLFEHVSALAIAIARNGRVERIATSRWGNPHDQPFAEVAFGGVIEEERTFGSYTIPSRLRVGWYFGTSRFDRDGEFFRCTLTDAQFK
jgi:hypothetical protein